MCLYLILSDHPQIGWEILKKPDVLNKIWFHGFPADREYDMGAIGFRINSKLRTSPQHQFTNMEFSFDDVRFSPILIFIASN